MGAQQQIISGFNAESAGPDPNPKTLVFACGFECGQLAVGAHWRNTAGAATFAVNTSTVRSGARSGRVTAANQNSRIQCDALGTSARWVGRVYIRFATLPDRDTYLCCSGTGSAASQGIAFKLSDTKIYAAKGSTGTSGVPGTFGASGVTVTTGVWYRVDFDIDASSGAGAADGAVDGVALGGVTANASAAGAAAFTWGAVAANSTMDFYADDWAISVTSADYPIGAGYVEHFVPTADGTHNVAGANQFERGTTGTDIDNTTTTAYQLVDEVPLDDATPDADDYISAIAPANATDYVEVVFGPAPGISAPTLGPRIADVLVAYHQATISTGNSRFGLNDNGTVDDVANFTAAGVTTVRYSRKAYADPPSAATAWTTAEGNGNFNNVRMRFYSSDAAPDQYWDGAMIEAEFSE